VIRFAGPEAPEALESLEGRYRDLLNDLALMLADRAHDSAMALATSVSEITGEEAVLELLDRGGVLDEAPATRRLALRIAGQVCVVRASESMSEEDRRRREQAFEIGAMLLGRGGEFSTPGLRRETAMISGHADRFHWLRAGRLLAEALGRCR
jgi:hypothetical protein